MAIGNVFIIMPFGEEKTIVKGVERTYVKKRFDDMYAILLRAVREHNKNVVVDRMEQPYGNLVDAIIRRLSCADVVIAVLTGRNPNVFYELGIRHSLRLNTIMLVEQWDEYPFDLSSYFSHCYAIDHETERDELLSFIKARLKDIEGQSLPDSPVLSILQKSEFEQLRIINTWETRKAGIIIEGLVREVSGMLSVFGQCLAYTNAIKDGKKVDVKHVNLKWHSIDGFTKNRPLPGLSAQAYADAESLYENWMMMERLWNTHLDKSKKPNAGDLQFIIADTHRRTCAFLHDLMDVWEYVMRQCVSFGLPWNGSYGDAEKVIPSVKILMNVDETLKHRLQSLQQVFHNFDQRFLGIPETLIQHMTTESAERAKSLAKVVETASRPPSAFAIMAKEVEKKRDPSRRSSTKKKVATAPKVPRAKKKAPKKKPR